MNSSLVIRKEYSFILDDRNDRYADNRQQYTFNQKAADKANKPKGEEQRFSV